jgi:hypothetical protein
MKLFQRFKLHLSEITQTSNVIPRVLYVTAGNELLSFNNHVGVYKTVDETVATEEARLRRKLKI